MAGNSDSDPVCCETDCLRGMRRPQPLRDLFVGDDIAGGNALEHPPDADMGHRSDQMERHADVRTRRLDGVHRLGSDFFESVAAIGGISVRKLGSDRIVELFAGVAEQNGADPVRRDSGQNKTQRALGGDVLKVVVAPRRLDLISFHMCRSHGSMRRTRLTDRAERCWRRAQVPHQPGTSAPQTAAGPVAPAVLGPFGRHQHRAEQGDRRRGRPAPP
jgi:hypothetical protein